MKFEASSAFQRLARSETRERFQEHIALPKVQVAQLFATSNRLKNVDFQRSIERGVYWHC